MRLRELKPGFGGSILGLYRDNGKENGNYYNRGYRDYDEIYILPKHVTHTNPIQRTVEVAEPLWRPHLLLVGCKKAKHW